MLNRKEKRLLKADKSLVCGLYNIIDKYFPKLFIMFENLSDARQQGKVTYPLKVICVTRLFGLICGITSMNSLTNKFNNNFTIDTISKITKTNLSELPHYDTINNVFDNLNNDELRTIQKYIVNALIRSKMFDKFRFNGKFQILVNGTGLISFNYKHCSQKAFRRKYLLHILFNNYLFCQFNYTKFKDVFPYFYTKKVNLWITHFLFFLKILLNSNYYFANFLKAFFAASCSDSFLLVATPLP